MPRPQPTAHGLWRPGLGLALWFTDEAGEPTADPDPAGLPAPVAEVLADRRPRRSVSLAGPDGRIVAPALTLGPERAAALLDALTPSDGAGDLRYLRWVAQSIERFVAAGAVTPVLRHDDGEWIVRWAPVESLQWRTWVQSAAAAMPPVLRRTGELAAVLDMATELADRYARQRLGDGPWSWVAAPALRALVDGEPLPPKAVADAGAAAAWTEWAGSVRSAETLLVLRLVEPDGRSPGENPLAPRTTPTDAPWRLEVCRRVPGAAPVRAEPARMSPVDLDDLAGELARALAVYPPLKRVAQDESSLDFLLTTEEAEALFLEGAPGLTKAGYEVLLPASIATVRPALRLVGREQPGRTALTVQAGLAEIKDFAWQLAVGDTVLTASELATLANSASGLVEVRGKWVRADRRTLATAARFVAEQRSAAESGTDVSELLGMIADPAALPAPLVAVDGLGWLDSVYRGGTITPAVVEAPSTLKAQLRDYQLRGLEWLVTLWRSGIGAVLADDMGLGKTIQVLALLCHERERAPDEPVRPTLLVCPMSVVGNWVAEAQRFAPGLRLHVHHGIDRPTGEEFGRIATASDVVVTTFALASRDRELLSGHHWGRLVVDEAQHVKNVNTAAAKALRSIPAAHRVALTGTPVENRLEDLRAVIDLVNPGLLGSARTFRNRFALPIEREQDQAAVRRLNTLTSPFLLRREKTDPAVAPELPEKAEFTVRASLTPEQAGLYQAVLNRLVQELRESQGMGRRGLVLASLTRLKQICNHPAHYLGDGSPLLRRGQHRSGKLELLADVLETVAADGERALVFTQYAEFARMLQPWLTGLLGAEVPVLDGAVPRTERDAMVARFQSGGGAPALVATVQSGGTGLNLTAANHVIHVDRWWNPAVENQATDRAFRIGQTRAVQVRKFVCAGTLEERIDGVIAAKKELSSMTVRTGEAWLTELNNDELYELVALRDEAVV
ncbi:DEAD/DEAH box helicase [Tsukamurella sputi]|uniref:DEAD/DEAH box helicase n=1 Tax=Tsukamurella sputi TaxID=2591848 RepID=A0A5C5RLY2_9ACTN|nr:DEAD/DEAH box helicase [Tsukamurella sputi]TWS23740.1 DEAD/DEAH box helicase [Tsukamurella sputi]